MSRVRGIPIRLCAGCQSRDAQTAMVRFTIRDGRLALDRAARAPGRGAYLHPRRACAEAFVARKPLVRSLRASVSRAERARFVGEERLFA